MSRKLQAQWLVQSMRPGRTVLTTASIHGSERAGQRGLKVAVHKWPMSTWRLIKQEEVEWWPR